jgi:hypothetical protein
MGLVRRPTARGNFRHSGPRGRTCCRLTRSCWPGIQRRWHVAASRRRWRRCCCLSRRSTNAPLHCSCPRQVLRSLRSSATSVSREPHEPVAGSGAAGRAAPPPPPDGALRCRVPGCSSGDPESFSAFNAQCSCVPQACRGRVRSPHTAAYTYARTCSSALRRLCSACMRAPQLALGDSLFRFCQMCVWPSRRCAGGGAWRAHCHVRHPVGPHGAPNGVSSTPRTDGSSAAQVQQAGAVGAV